MPAVQLGLDRASGPDRRGDEPLALLPRVVSHLGLLVFGSELGTERR